MAVFPFDPDWTSPVREKVSYLTKILPGYSGKEQRISLRTKPRRELTFGVFAEDASQAQLLDSLLTGDLSVPWIVPWWMDQVRYDGTLAKGAMTIPVSTINTQFAIAKTLLIWESATSFETKGILNVSPTLITCSRPMLKAWTNPIVVPLFTGTMADAQPIDWMTSKISRAEVKFSVDA